LGNSNGTGTSPSGSLFACKTSFAVAVVAQRLLPHRDSHHPTRAVVTCCRLGPPPPLLLLLLLLLLPSRRRSASRHLHHLPSLHKDDETHKDEDEEEGRQSQKQRHPPERIAHEARRRVASRRDDARTSMQPPKGPGDRGQPQLAVRPEISPRRIPAPSLRPSLTAENKSRLDGLFFAAASFAFPVAAITVTLKSSDLGSVK
jgi:hypothetical protein